MPEKQNRLGSLSMMTASMLIFGTIGLFRKWIPLSSALLSCCRGASGALFLLLVMALRKKRARQHIGKRTVILLVLSGAMIGFNWILLFEAYHYTTVATATLCYYMQPIILVLLSPMLLKEKLTLKKGLCVLAALLGMAFVSGFFENGLPGAEEAKGILLGLGAAALYAAVVLVNKRLPGMDAFLKTILQLASAVLAVLPYVLLTEDIGAAELTMKTALLVVLVGIVHTGIAYTLYFASMDGLKAQSIAVISYLDPIFALVLSACILKEPMTVYGVIGAVLILGAALVSEWPARSVKNAKRR